MEIVMEGFEVFKNSERKYWLKGEKGKATLPAKRFHDILKTLESEEVSISVEENKTSVVSNIDGNGAHFKLLGLKAEEFPILPTIEAYTLGLPQEEIIGAFARVVPMISTDEMKQVLNGVLLEGNKDSLKFVATDGRRLARFVKKTDLFDGLSVIISGKTIKALLRLGAKNNEEIQIGLGKSGKQENPNLIGFKFGNIEMVSNLIDGQFPNYEIIFPKKSEAKVLANRKELLEALNRVSLLSSEKYSVKFEFQKSGKLIMTSKDPEVGDAREVMEVGYEGEAISILFNAGYVWDVLNAMESEMIGIALVNGQSPGVFKETNFSCVVMPMKER